MRFAIPSWLRSVRDVLGSPSKPQRRKAKKPNRLASYRPAFENLEERTLMTASSVTGILTADNHYGLYVGDASGSNLTLIGRNENTYAGSPGTYNWSLPETFNFSVDEGDYLYVVAWDDNLQQMFAGQFTVDDVTLYTNTTQWQYTVGSGTKPTETGPLPADSLIQSDIATATWLTPTASAPNGTSPWGTISGLDSNVQFIWPDTLSSSSSFDNNYVIFRTASPFAPGNQPPTANDDSAVTNQGQALAIAINDLLLNDSDPDGDFLEITSVSATSAYGGTVGLDTNTGTVTYTPTVTHFGSDSFTYTITDAHGWTDTATVFVDVRSITGMTATLTADNHYGLYYGAGDGSSLHFVGRNEFGAAGAPGQYNWSLPETHEFNVGVGDHIYIVVWDDGGPQSWIGQFALPGGGTLATNATDWEFVLGGVNPGALGDAPDVAELMTHVAGATWLPVGAAAANGSAPWGTIPGISSAAQFIWHDTLDATSGSDANGGRYVIYRTEVAVNLPPLAANPGPRTSAERDPIQLQITAADPENDPVTYSAAGLPDGLVINATTGLISGTLTCDAYDLTGGHTIVTVTITDTAGASSNQTFGWTIANVAVKNVYWTGAGDGYRWNDANNWDILDTPSHCDAVFIDVPGLTVLHEAGDVEIHSLHSSANIDFTGGLMLARASSVSGDFRFSGELHQVSEALDLTGGGEFSGSFQGDADTTLNFLNGTFAVNDGMVFTGLGEVNVGGGQAGGSGDVRVKPGTVQAEDIWNVKRDGTIEGEGTFLIKKRLNWSGGEMKGPGTTEIATGAVFSISGNDDKKMVNGRVLSIHGSTDFSGGGLFVSGRIDNDGTFSITQDGLEMIAEPGLEGAVFNNRGTVVKQGGSGSFVLEAIEFNNEGRVEVESGDFVFGGRPGVGFIIPGSGKLGGIFEVAQGSRLWFPVGDYTLEPELFDSPSDMFRGDGLVVAGSGNDFVRATLTIPQSNVVEAQNFQLDEGAQLHVFGTFSATNFNWNEGTIGDPNPQTLAPGGSVVVPVGGHMMINASPLQPSQLAGVSILNRGQVDWLLGNIAVSKQASIITDGGIFETSIAGTITDAGAAGRFIVRTDGALRVSPSEGNQPATIDLVVENRGGAVAIDGTADFLGGYLQDGGMTSVAGTLNTDDFVQNGGTTTVDGIVNSDGVIQRGGLIAVTGTLNYGRASIVDGGSVVLNGGTLGRVFELQIRPGASVSGTGVIEGNVFNSGQLTFKGSIEGSLTNENNGVLTIGGMATISGNFTQQAQGVLNVQVGGTAPSQFGNLRVGLTANLNGTLNAALVNNFTPNPLTPDAFDIFTATGGVIGTFPTTNLQLGGGLFFGIVYGQFAVILETKN